MIETVNILSQLKISKRVPNTLQKMQLNIRLLLVRKLVLHLLYSKVQRPSIKSLNLQIMANKDSV